MTQNDALAKSDEFIQAHRKDGFLSFFLGGIRRSAVVETFAFFCAAVLINFLFGDGTRFIDVNPHPFWIIILLVIVQYGQREAVFAALLATAFLLLGNMPEQSLTETMYDYYFRIFLQPLLWIIMALLLGSIRSRQFREREDLFERLWKSEESTHILATSYVALKRAKEELELRLAQERRSVLTVYQMARSVHSVTKETLLDTAGRLITVALHPSKYSIFWCKENGLVLAQSVGWGKDDAFAHSFDKNAPIMTHLMKSRQTLSIVNETHEKVLGSEGVLAGPILDEKTGKLLGMLKVEEMEFIDMGVNTHETFGILCEWIALAYAIAEKQRKHRMDDIRLSGKSLMCISRPASKIEITLPELFLEVPSEIS